MANLKTKYAGIELKNPLIIGSSSLTGNISNLKKMEELGAGAVVLKSIFEEEVTNEFQKIIQEFDKSDNRDMHIDYFDKKIKQDNISDYIGLIKEAKKELSIPVIASVNCIHAHDWTYFVKRLEEAKVDAIELNIYYFPADFSISSSQMEERYIKVIQEVKSVSKIPIMVKMSQYFTNLGEMIQRVAATGVDGITLFNRFYKPDIDLKTKKLTTANVFSNAQEYVIPLQWLALMNSRVPTQMAASTGIHDGASFVKLLMAGSTVNYIVSTLYKNGFEVIGEILKYLEDYLDNNGYNSVEDIVGLLSQKSIENPKYYERAQFMKYFTGSKDIV